MKKERLRMNWQGWAHLQKIKISLRSKSILYGKATRIQQIISVPQKLLSLGKKTTFVYHGWNGSLSSFLQLFECLSCWIRGFLPRFPLQLAQDVTSVDLLLIWRTAMRHPCGRVHFSSFIPSIRCARKFFSFDIIFFIFKFRKNISLSFHQEYIHHYYQ